jgi:hypothetical protein
LALCVCQLMKMDGWGGGGCRDGGVTVPVELIYSVFTINIQIQYDPFYDTLRFSL